MYIICAHLEEWRVLGLDMPIYCSVDGCDTRAKFGDPETGKATHCAAHGKPLGYVDVNNKRCAIDGCDTRANFGDPETGKATHCAAHGKPLGLVDVANKRCAIDGCNKHRFFGDPKTGKATHCATHGKPLGLVDVKNKRCAIDGCDTRASFGDPETGERTHCATHGKPLGLVDVNNKRCAVEGCDTRANFGDPKTGMATHCCQHGTPLGYVDVLNPRCLSEHCSIICPPPGYNGYCTDCFRHMFPTDPRTANIRAKTRELTVRDALVGWYGDAFIHNTTMHFGCDCAHRRSIDFRYLVGNTMIAVEVDEGQHKSRDSEDETIRYDDLFMAGHGGKWIYIRFNPDSYVDANGKRVKGFFNSKNDRRSREIERRLDSLKTCVDTHIDRARNDKNDDLLEIIYLFFDEDLR